MARNKKHQDRDSGESLRSKLVPELGLGHETKKSVAVVVFVVLALLTLLVLVGIAGSLGAVIFRFLRGAFGFLAYLTPFGFFTLAFLLHRQSAGSEDSASGFARVYLGAALMFGGVAGIVHLFFLGDDTSPLSVAAAGSGGGYLGALFSLPVFGPLGFAASAVILVALVVIGVLVSFDLPLSSLWPKKEIVEGAEAAVEQAPVRIVQQKVRPEPVPEAVEEEPSKPKSVEMKINVPNLKSDAKLEVVAQEDHRDWKLPSFDLLDGSQTDVDSGDIEANVAVIKKTLADFGIEAEMGEVNVGPTVTQYTFAPEAGVKLSQIAQLQNNLAMALAARSLRMELPIPGKALVGVEIPNKTTRTVRLREVMQQKDFTESKHRLVIAIGRDVSGQVVQANLSTMPHLLVAGASGKGKSVAMNSMLVSLLYRNTPQQVKFIVIDPKRVEMTPYNGIPHLLTPVITEPDKAVNALKWAVSEMDRRYKLMAEAGVRDIGSYNESSGLQLPYIVVVVDELADLMAVAKNEMESTIVRLAQMARAIGIHLVLATQRPSVDVLTGLIKANITSRMAFAVASQTDSRTILDSSGAEKLLGNGDMLFVSADYDKPRRVQGAYLSSGEVKKVVDFFKAQAGAVIYDDAVTEKPKRALGIPGMEGESGGDDDPLLEQAKEEVTRAGKASTSFLQRKLKVGYARAARLIDLLEEAGVVGPGEGAKPREVYGSIPSSERAEYGVEDPDEFPLE